MALIVKTRILILFALFFVARTNAQECGTRLPTQYSVIKATATSSLSSTLLPHDTCLNKTLSVMFYIVLDSMGNPNVTNADIATCIANLNKYFKPICITFQACSTQYIPNYNYNEWVDYVHEPIVKNNYYTPNTINIYLVGKIVSPGGATGYAHMPGAPDDFIVISKGSLTGITPVHEMGHYFGLPHTFETANGAELVNGSNSTTAGDGFTDTDADPYPTGNAPMQAPCDYIYGPKDANGQYYTPPVDNIMTYFKPCRCRFTQEQYNFMALMYITQRTYLH